MIFMMCFFLFIMIFINKNLFSFYFDARAFSEMINDALDVNKNVIFKAIISIYVLIDLFFIIIAINFFLLYFFGF